MPTLADVSISSTLPRNSSAGAPPIARIGAAAIGGTMLIRKEGWPGDGVSRVSFDPYLTSLEAPALWLQPACDAVVVLGRAPPGVAGAVPSARIGTPIQSHDIARQRHLVIDAEGARQRFLILDSKPEAGLMIVLPVTGEAAFLAAASARAYLATRRARPNPALRPTPFQRRRLAMLLAILDAAQGGASNREIGTGIIYPRLAGIAAQAWKASSERRHTQRMIVEAHAMMRDGYRRLLAGGV